MSAKASVDSAKRNSNHIHEEDDTVSSEKKMRPKIPTTEAKQKPRRSETSAKKRRATIYTPEFKAEILEFVKENKYIVAVRQFGIPESTLRDWISKASKRKIKEAAARPEMDGNIFSSGTSPLITNQEGNCLIIDIPGLSQTDSKLPPGPLINDNNDHKELSDKNSPKKVYTGSFKEMVVKFGESKSWKAAGAEFGVPSNTVGLWARQLGRKGPSKSKGIDIDDETKEKAVQYSLQMNSWKRAAQKFGFSPNVVALWGKKAGCKLKSKIETYADMNDEAKDEIVKYAVKQNNWSRAARKFGVSKHIVASWGKKAGCKLKSKYPDSFKETVVNFGEGESWKAAAAKYGVWEGTVGKWARQLGKGKKVSLRGEAKDEIIKYGLKHNSWREAAAKFGVSRHTVIFWGKKAGYKLKHGGRKKNSLNSVEPPQPNLLSSRDQRFPLHTDHEELKKEKRNHDVISEDIEHAVVSVDGHSMKTSAKKIGNRVVFKWSKKLKVCKVDSDSKCSKLGTGEREESGPCSRKLTKGSPVKSKAVINDNIITSIDDANYYKHDERVTCEACGKALAADETLDEHVVSVHLTIEGLCNICGEDSEDFVDHFKVHLKSCKHEVELDTLDTIKKENIDVDDNQNFKNYHESDLVVKDENEGSETLKGKRLYINPFYST